MAIKIRLSRNGRKKRPFYEIIVTKNTNTRDSKFIEKLGFYNPLYNKNMKYMIMFKTNRINYWLSKGAKMTDIINSLLTKYTIKQ